MKTGKSAMIVMGILLLCFVFANTALAADLKGTWTGAGKVATNKGYQSFTLTAKITSQNGTLFRGTVTVKDTETKNYGLIGYVTGSKVYMTMYEISTGEPDTLVEGTLTANSTKIAGVVLGTGAWLGYCTLTKQ